MTKHHTAIKVVYGVWSGHGVIKPEFLQDCSMLIPVSCMQIAHFRVAACISFKASPGAQPFKWKWVAYSYANQTHFPYNSWAPRLTSKPRQTATRKWPIETRQAALSRYPSPSAPSSYLWGRNAWRNPKNVAVGGLLKCNPEKKEHGFLACRRTRYLARSGDTKTFRVAIMKTTVITIDHFRYLTIQLDTEA